MLESVLDTVGRAPLVLLNRLTEGRQAKVAVKVEFANPGGLAMIAGGLKQRDGLARQTLLVVTHRHSRQ